MSFGHGAARLSGLAARLLGWRPDEFWRSTPAEFAAVLAPLDPEMRPFGRDELTRMMEREHERPR